MLYQLDPLSPTGLSRVEKTETFIGSGSSSSSSSSGDVSDAAYDASWNGDTSTAPSKNAVYDKIENLTSEAIAYAVSL